jgi:hypothetical protein
MSYVPPRDKTKEELKRKIKALEEELLRKEEEIEEWKSRAGRVDILGAEMKKLVEEVSSLKEKLSSDQLDKRFENELASIRTRLDQITVQLPKPVTLPSYPVSRLEPTDPPIWRLLEPGTYFEYIAWDTRTGDGIGWEKYTVLSKSNENCEIMTDVGGPVSVSYNEKYKIDKRNKIHSMMKNGINVDVSHKIYQVSSAKDCPYPHIWVNPNEIRINDTILYWGEDYNVISIETFNNRECYVAERRLENIIVKIYFDVKTGIVLRKYPTGGGARDLIKTNLSELTSYRGNLHPINPNRAKERFEQMISELEKIKNF